MKIVTAEQMQDIDRRCAGIGLPVDILMENAGKEVAGEIKRIFGKIDNRRFVFLIGPGNNGGDGLVAARYLHDWESDVIVYLCSDRPPNDRNLELLKQRQIPCLHIDTDEGYRRIIEIISSSDAVIDAIFGTGKIRPLEDKIRVLFEKIQAIKSDYDDLLLIALDLPSGLNATSGEAYPSTLFADFTITLGLPKIGLFQHDGAGHAGQISIVDIGIPEYMADKVSIELITKCYVKSSLPRRHLTANKGSFGKALALAGSENYIGAAFLACSGALRSGAGLVTLAVPDKLKTIIAGMLPEAVYITLPEESGRLKFPESAGLIQSRLNEFNVLLIGCGLGTSERMEHLLEHLLFETGPHPLPPLVIDADALNFLSEIKNRVKQITGNAVLTPHPGEFSRLTGLPIAEIQKDRIGTALKFANEWQKTIVLKGAYTVIAAPDGRLMVSPFANPGLATAGSGDVLAGIISGFIAQGMPLFEAAVCGVYVHGLSGEQLRSQSGDTGMLAGDLLSQIPKAIKAVKEPVH